jgi:hypothetical protein
MIPVNKTNVSSTQLSSGEAEHSKAGPAPAAARRIEATTHGSGWTPGVISALVIGAVFCLVSVGLLGAGGTALWADQTRRDADYLTSDVHDFSTTGSALATEPTRLGSAGVGWLYAPGLLDEIRIRVTPSSQSSELFVGIAASADVGRYLAGVSHAVISDFWTSTVETKNGGTPTSAPGTQNFWVASTTGSGSQTLTWEPANGSWTVVVMNADGKPALDVQADLGARIPALLWISVGLLAAGAVVMSGGALLILGAIRRRRASQAETPGPG